MNKNIEDIYNYVMDTLSPKEDYKPTLCGEELNLEDPKMLVASAYQMGLQEGLSRGYVQVDHVMKIT